MLHASRELLPRLAAGKFLQAPAFFLLAPGQFVFAILVGIVTVPEQDDKRRALQFEVRDEFIGEVTAIAVRNGVRTAAVNHDSGRQFSTGMRVAKPGRSAEFHRWLVRFECNFQHPG